MGLLDLFGGGNDLYGGLLDPQAKQALASRGLLAAAGALGQAAMPSRMPIPTGAALGQAAAAFGSSQDEAALNALRAKLIGLQGQDLASQLDIRKQLMPLIGGIANGQGGSPTAPSMLNPTSAVSGIPTPSESLPSISSVRGGGSGGWGPQAEVAAETLRKAGWSEAAIQGALANALAEGGLQESWKPGDNGTSFGHWQFHKGGELNGYLAFAKAQNANPNDTATQALFLAKRMEEIHPGFGQIDDPKRATDIIGTQFERYQGAGPGQRYGHLATAQQRLGSGNTVPNDLPAVPDFTGMLAGNQGPGYAPKGLLSPVSGPPDAVVNPALAGNMLKLSPVAFDQRMGLSNAYADALDKGFKGTIQDFAASQGGNVAQSQSEVAPPSIPQVTGNGQPYTPPPALAAQMAGGARPVQGGMLAQAAPPSAPSMLSPPQVATPPSMLQSPAGWSSGLTPRQVFGIGALSDMAKIPALGKAASELYYQSPEYLQGKEFATQTGRNQSDVIYQPQITFGKTAAERSITEPSDIRIAEAKARLDRETKALEQGGAAALDMTELTVSDGKGGYTKIPATREQAVRAATGAGVPELGIPPINQGGAPQLAQPQQSGLRPGGALGMPAFTPGQTAGQTDMAKVGTTALDTAFQAELAANKRTQVYGQMAEAMQGFKPGATAEMKLRADRILKDVLGVGLFGQGGAEVPAAEVFQQAGRHLQITAAPKGQGSVSNFERELFSQAVPNMTNSPEGLTKAIEIATRLDNYDREVAKIHRQVAKDNNNIPDYLEAQQRIAALGPPLSPAEMSALEQAKSGKVPRSSARPSGTTQSGIKWSVQ